MKLILAFVLTIAFCKAIKAQSLDEAFLHPAQEAKPIMIWQWMDGLVSKEGITADLEAYREAGLGGVQQFQVGGPGQVQVCDSSQAIGTDKWKRLMQHAIRECSRLGLSFGTHNCPGWSSSAYPTVKPEYSMQQLVCNLDTLPPYYHEVAVVAVPDTGVVRLQDVVVLSPTMTPPLGKWRILRFGHAPTGKTNDGTAPLGGVGLECDKMSRESVRHFWQGYPEMLLSLVPEEVGKTFSRLEIDSYEGGFQGWTHMMPEEFLKRRGYDITPWLPVFAGITIESEEATKKFRKDWQETVTDLFAENYYGYMNELVRQRQGMQLLVEPYSTGGSKPFNPINTAKITRSVGRDALIAAEFWTKPDTWGWRDVPRVVNAARSAGHERVYAEAFTCWPMHAWKDGPAEIKQTADRAFCLGVNALMLHAGAHNPWVGREPGMTFGYWGTWFTPGQTWWKSGAAKLLFSYFSHCQALLQRGRFIDDWRSKKPSLHINQQGVEWLHRKDGDADIYFIANRTDSVCQSLLTFNFEGRQPEIWHPEYVTIRDAEVWQVKGHQTQVSLHLNAHEALFVVFRKATHLAGPGLDIAAQRTIGEVALPRAWSLTFPDGNALTLDNLIPWNVSAIDDVKYFSGTATYRTTFRLKRVQNNVRYVLQLGEVRDMARIRVNGKECAHLWHAPFEADITDALQKGDNTLEIDVTNQWVNRMIGDEQQPDDVEWSEPFRFGAGPGQPAVGRFMTRVPEWLKNCTPRPSQGRKAVVSFKFYEKNAPLLRSGMMGPVRLEKQLK